MPKMKEKIHDSKNEVKIQMKEKNKLYESIKSAKNITTNCESILKIGSLKFDDSSLDEKPFMTADHNVSVEECVHQVLYKQWEIKQPLIVVLMISNVGPLKEWTNSVQIKHFQRGLMKAADNTNMWLITNAINIGLSSIIGEAVRNEITKIKRSRNRNSLSLTSKLNFIGIADENLLRYAKSIADTKEYTIPISNIGSNIGETKYELNPNLTHNIIIRDKTFNKTGVNTFLTNFTKFVTKLSENANKKDSIRDSSSISGVEIPFVSIVIQGGYESSRLVLQQIKNEIPVIVLGGSGGLADLLAFVESETRQRCPEVWDPEYIESYIKPELNLKIASRFPQLRDNALLCNTFRNRILDCVRESRKGDQIFLTVINISNNYSCDLENLSEYLLLALFKSQSSEEFNQIKTDISSSITSGDFKPNPGIVRRELYLCVDWNCPEVAKREVINKDPSFGHYLDKNMFEEALTRNNRTDFIDLFLTNGFKLRTFVTSQRLKKLFHNIHNQNFFRTVCWESILGFSSEIKQSENFINKELNWLMNVCTGIRNFFDENELNLHIKKRFPRSQEEEERKALAIIIIWSLFNFRKKLVKILWKHSDQPIHMALIIAMIYERLAFYVTDGSLKEEVESESKLFISYAYKVLDICYKDSPERAEEVLNEKNKDWNYKSPVDTAAFARHRTFLSHPCCQKWLTDTFYGNIKVRETHLGFIQFPILVKIILSAFFVFPMYFWIRFKDNTKSIKNSSNEEDFEDENEVKNKKQKINNYNNNNSENNELIIHNSPPLSFMIYELWNSPITKFWIYQLFFCIYLSLFSLAVLYPKCGNYKLDLTICVWTSLTIADLIQRTYVFHIKHINHTIGYKVFEIVIQILFVMVYGSERVLYHQTFPFIKPYDLKVILCLNLLYNYYILFTIYFPISATLGPLLYRLKVMILVDFLNYLRMAVLAMIIFGLFSLFTISVNKLFENKNCSEFLRKSPSDVFSCPNTGIWPYIVWIIYLIPSKLILITLLYAIFASTASKTSDTDKIWKFQRYRIVMDFKNRSPLPPPLNIFNYIFLFFRSISYICYNPIPDKNNSLKFATFLSNENSTKLLSKEDYNYLKSIAYDYYEEEENKLNNETIIRQQWERLQANSEEIEFSKNVIKELKGKLCETERSVRQSLVYLESIKHLTNKKFGMDYEMNKSKLHVISRHSPYFHTNVQRYPVSDKYVSWDVLFIDYDPIAYTKPAKDFPINLQQFADEDILKLQSEQIEEQNKKLPILAWNRKSTNAAGITIDRESWQMIDSNTNIVYKLDNGIPRNPFGRTGLRGRGSLLRWGPNHYIMIVITRMNFSNNFEVVIEIDLKQTSLHPISLLTRFISGEISYTEIEDLFITDNEHKGWTDCEKMIDFFKSSVISDEKPIETITDTTLSLTQTGLIYERVMKGYCDASLNTDNAWKEIELWHFHYTNKDSLNQYMKQNIEWREVNEDLFAKLNSLTQSHVLQDIVHKFNINIHT